MLGLIANIADEGHQKCFFIDISRMELLKSQCLLLIKSQFSLVKIFELYVR